MFGLAVGMTPNILGIANPSNEIKTIIGNHNPPLVQVFPSFNTFMYPFDSDVKLRKSYSFSEIFGW